MGKPRRPSDVCFADAKTPEFGKESKVLSNKIIPRRRELTLTFLALLASLKHVSSCEKGKAG